MSIWRSLSGQLLVELVSAAPEQLLSAINSGGVPVFDVIRTGELCLQIRIKRSDYKALMALANKQGATIRILRREGVFWTIAGFRRRYMLLAALTLFIVAVLYLPTRILFVQTEGNRIVSTETLLQEAQNCGVGFWSLKRNIRSERVKNTLLERIPELQWVGVNTRGCVAVISVKERAAVDMDTAQTGICSIVAAQDGIVKEMTVYRGNPLCKVGQAVKTGDILVSGYTDCGLSVKAEAADAEIYADTVRSLVSKTPLQYVGRCEKGSVNKKYSLQIGKKMINFFKGSGISGTSCVKMYQRYALTLPGVFELPVALVCYTESAWDAVEAATADASELYWVENYLSDYLRGQMLAGSIRSSHTSETVSDSLYIRSVQYACTEMIGQVRTEEIVQNNGKRN